MLGKKKKKKKRKTTVKWRYWLVWFMTRIPGILVGVYKKKMFLCVQRSKEILLDTVESL